MPAGAPQGHAGRSAINTALVNIAQISHPRGFYNKRWEDSA